MRIWLMIGSILLIFVVGSTNINTDFILLSLLIILTLCLVNMEGMNSSLAIVFYIAVFLAMITSAIAANYLEGKSLVLYMVTALLCCIHIRFMKTKSTNDIFKTKEN